MPDTSQSLHQQTIRDRRLQAFIGARANEVDKLDRDYVNSDPQTKQVDTITVDTFSAAADYVFTFNGVEYTMTEDGTGAGVNDVAEQLGEFIEDQGAIYGFVDVSVATDTVTLTAKVPGYSYTVSDSDAKLTTASVTASDEADPIDFGRAVIRQGFVADNAQTVDGIVERACLAQASSFQEQITQWSVADPGTGQVLSLFVEVPGVSKVSAQVSTSGTLDTDLDALATAANAAFADFGLDSYVSAEGPSGDPDSGEFAILAEIGGVEFLATLTCDDAAGYPAIAEVGETVAPSLSTSLLRALAGVSIRRHDQEASSANPSSAQVAANETFNAAERGFVWVDNDDGVSLGDQVFVDLSAGEGKFYNAAGSNRIPLPLSRAEWVRDGRSLDGETIAMLRLK